MKCWLLLHNLTRRDTSVGEISKRANVKLVNCATPRMILGESNSPQACNFWDSHILYIYIYVHTYQMFVSFVFTYISTFFPAFFTSPKTAIRWFSGYVELRTKTVPSLWDLGEKFSADFFAEFLSPETFRWIRLIQRFWILWFSVSEIDELKSMIRLKASLLNP